MTRPLRILTVADQPPDPNSGAAGTVWHTNVALRELGHTVDEIWADQLGPRRIKHGNLHSILEQPRAYRREVKGAISQKDYDVIQMSQPEAWLASKYLKQIGFRGIVINRSHGLELRMNSVLPRWHKELGVSESTFPRSLLTPLLRYLQEKQWGPLVKYNDGAIVPCEMDRSFLLDYTKCDSQKVCTIHHGVPDSFLNTPPPRRTDTELKKIIFVGQLSFFKGPYILIQILNTILKMHPDLHVSWVTAESARSWISEHLQAELTGRVKILPWCSQSELLSLYDSHGIMLFPSLCEGAGKAALEGLSRGLCVIASDTSGMHDYISQGYNGFLCEVGNVEQFVERLNQVLGNPKTIRAIGEQASRSTSDYSWKRCAEKAVDFYSTLGKR